MTQFLFDCAVRTWRDCGAACVLVAATVALIVFLSGLDAEEELLDEPEQS